MFLVKPTLSFYLSVIIKLLESDQNNLYYCVPVFKGVMLQNEYSVILLCQSMYNPIAQFPFL